MQLVCARTRVSEVKEINKFLQLMIPFNAFIKVKNK